MDETLDYGPDYPTVGQYMIHCMGEGHDEVFASLPEAQAAAVEEKGGDPSYPVYVLQVVAVV